MKKQVCSSLLALSMTASILSPAALAAEITVPDDNQNTIAVVSENDAAVDQTNSEQNESEEVTVNVEADFKTEDVDGGVAITGYTGTTRDVVIPATIGGKPVVSIGEEAFLAKVLGAQEVEPGLTSVTIPKSVTSIGARAFCNNMELSSITLPDSLKTIGESAFHDCKALSSITIPDSVESIGQGAFKYCGNLTEITIPDKVTRIEIDTFRDCTKLTKATFPRGLTYIGSKAFAGTELNTIVYGGTAKEWYANVTIADSNIEVQAAQMTFKETKQSGDFIYEITDADEVSIVEYTGSKESVTIPETLDDKSVTSIGTRAFYQKPVTVLTIPTSVKSIGKEAFYKVRVQNLTLPEGLESIGESAFADCGEMYRLSLPSTLKTIGENAFDGCCTVWYINIPASVESIGASAFHNWGNLHTVNYGSTKADWDKLGSSIGKDNDQLLNATRYYNLGDYTYQLNEKDEVSIMKYNGKDGKVDIPATLEDRTVTSIGTYAFQQCEAVKKVTIPSSVTSIGENAFADCTLETAYYDGYKEDLSIADGNEPLTKVLTYKSKIICEGSKEVKISTGTHQLCIHDTSYGEYTFTWVEDQAGWTVQNAEKQYLSFADGELVLSDEPFVWHYDAKLYTTTEEKVQHNFWWWSYTTTKTVYWYLTGDGENLTISKSDKEADLALYDAVEATEHSFTEWSYVGDKTHRRVCTVCGEKETAECTYGEDGYCTECGQFNPDLASVSVTAKVTKHTTRSGWWWWCRPTTTWTANITAAGEGVDVETVEYSLDGEAYETGTCFTSKEEITTFYIRVTDSNDNVTNWIYEDGEVTQVTDQDSEQTPDQGSEQDSTEQG